MQKQLAIAGLALALNACGDGNDDIFRGVDGSSSGRLTGVYLGSFTDENLNPRSILGAIEKTVISGYCIHCQQIMVIPVLCVGSFLYRAIALVRPTFATIILP